MLFFSLSVIIGLAASVVSIKTLTGYTSMRKIYKFLIGTLIVAGWFAPFIVVFVRRRKWLDPETFSLFSQGAFCLFGVCFLLLCLGLLAGLAPAYRAMSVKPIDAIRDE